jgi:hypothetical protein
MYQSRGGQPKYEPKNYLNFFILGFFIVKFVENNQNSDESLGCAAGCRNMSMGRELATPVLLEYEI